ncbi:hypothetical protein POV27_04200 [Aureisphaera galaxeae]|uniref:LA_2272 family surface repeat-containing protein n=1 Tax=Aureisphaera galaxeae TaxID=1538023 RepID=UPI00234FD7BC|nr:hypothetical protein [Aureisphaera galaxeae]MDC8003237.1 hypothetical protein [Aureisphaera galaxeae]
MKIKILLTAILLTGFLANAQKKQRKLRAPIWITHSKNTDVVGVSFGILPKSLFNDSTLTRTFGMRVEPSILGAFSWMIDKSPVATNEDSFKMIMSEAPTEIIYGGNLSTGIFGEAHVHGFSAGIFMQQLYRMNGIAVTGMMNLVQSGNGVFIGGFGNELYKGNGIAAGFGNLGYRYNGIQVGILNTIKETGHGLQLGLENDSQKFNGVQFGFMNIVDESMIGLQIGLWNNANSLRGIQLGLWNKNGKRSLPFINWQFKG